MSNAMASPAPRSKSVRTGSGMVAWYLLVSLQVLVCMASVFGNDPVAANTTSTPYLQQTEAIGHGSVRGIRWTNQAALPLQYGLRGSGYPYG